jgi:UrcA family protein
MQRTHYLAAVAGTLLALGTSFGTALAAESVATNSHAVTVEYGDLELGNGVAVDKLYARIAAAARRACGYYDSRSLRAIAAWRTCYDDAVADALERLQLTAVAERHRSDRERPVG